MWPDPITYGEIVGVYVPYFAGQYNLMVTNNSGDEVLVDLVPFTLSDGDILDFLVVGDDGNQFMGVFGYPFDEMGNLFEEEKEASITVSKTPDLQVVASGGKSDFEVTVKNSGNITLTNVILTDPLVPGCNANLGTMIPGAVKKTTCSKDNVTVSFANVSQDDPAALPA